MNKDKAIEDLFLARKPHFDDSEAFMSSLIKRLDAVEYVKQQQEATIRRYKKAMIAAFVIGLISGGCAMVYFLSMPTDVPLFTFNVQSRALQWIAENSRLLAIAALSLLTSICLISIVGNVQDISSMQRRMKVLQP